MSTTDWILLALLAASMVLGAWRGLVYEVLSVLGWIAAFLLAQWFAPEVADMLPMSKSEQTLRYAAGFVLVFIASVFAAGLISALMKKSSPWWGFDLLIEFWVPCLEFSEA